MKGIHIRNSYVYIMATITGTRIHQTHTHRTANGHRTKTTPIQSLQNTLLDICAQRCGIVATPNTPTITKQQPLWLAADVAKNQRHTTPAREGPAAATPEMFKFES